MTSLKLELICNICKLILKDPISLPCLSAVCGEHLHDDSTKNGIITCMKCNKEFKVPESGFPQNEVLSNILAKEFHLNDEEKAIKHSIQDMIQTLEGLQEVLKQNNSDDLEANSFEHYSEIRRKIDIQREELKAKIDEIAIKMIAQVNEKEKLYNLNMTESRSAVAAVDIQQSRQILANEFRRTDLLIEDVIRLQDKLKQKTKEFESRIHDLDSSKVELENQVFKPSQGFQDVWFGSLRLQKAHKLIACSLGDKIKILDVESNKCVSTLEGHTSDITCLESIDENRFASGSYDKTVKI